MISILPAEKTGAIGLGKRDEARKGVTELEKESEKRGGFSDEEKKSLLPLKGSIVSLYHIATAPSL